MAFPVIESVGITEIGVFSTPQPLNYPTGIQAGDLLLTFVEARNTTLGAPSGWTIVDQQDHTLSAGARVFYKVADGTESGTFDDNAFNYRGGALCYRISGVGSSAPEGSLVTGTEGGTTFDPPLLTPSWGTKDTLWLTCYSKCATNGTYTVPTGFGPYDEAEAAGSTSNNNFPQILVASLELNAESLDPGVWTESGGNTWSPIVGTFAVEPATVEGPSTELSAATALPFADSGVMP